MANINSKGHCLSHRQVCESLLCVNQVDDNRMREDIVRRQNPVPYNAPYYGKKFGIKNGIKRWDQNKKPFTRSVMAAAQFDHHVTSSHCKVHCKTRGFACKQYPLSFY